jgi:hypothetical protein
MIVEKVLNLEELSLNELKLVSNTFLKKLGESLDKIDFFSGENSKNHNQEVFTILKSSPKENDPINGQNYIRKDYLDGNKIIGAEIYDFDLRIISTCF